MYRRTRRSSIASVGAAAFLSHCMVIVIVCGSRGVTRPFGDPRRTSWSEYQPLPPSRLSRLDAFTSLFPPLLTTPLFALLQLALHTYRHGSSYEPQIKEDV